MSVATRVSHQGGVDLHAALPLHVQRLEKVLNLGPFLKQVEDEFVDELAQTQITGDR